VIKTVAGCAKAEYLNKVIQEQKERVLAENQADRGLGGGGRSSRD
jgi:hypothetical protein